ncbi:cell envelope integrity TolA C-terminal domain-containing protein [Erwinia sp. Eh17-17]|jgi:membrane protein involved in colicin uptake|uniref:cell envelope integrity TolA C-terminal domain-containing protein n=1 Tax=Erwinia sp. Eh17-17 TaxID=3080330 RepID=UPI003207A86B
MKHRYFASGLLILVGLLTACHSAPNPPGDTECDAQCGYLATMKTRILRNFEHAERYHGRACDVTLAYSARQRYQVLRTTGDEALCLKVWGVVASTESLPPPPLHLTQAIVIQFRP